MKAIDMETVIDSDGKLPAAFHEAFGRKARVIVLFQEESPIATSENESARLMELAGKINAFRDIEDTLAFQRNLRDEWTRG
ncbi:MAG: hypothetical protein C4527_16710 [Candidatus Omnitrophota bacterium]|jgi:hypothetical protein|nr:MAG: hypothetical protein C4527_16710 [Candidatus Omnitrophota bacterium]